MSRKNIDDAVALARSSGVAIVVIGGNELTGKEGEDSDDINLVGHQTGISESCVCNWNTCNGIAPSWPATVY